MPVSERDVYAVAKLLVDQHGDRAPADAQRRADGFCASGDGDGHAHWLRIKAAAEELLAVAPTPRAPEVN